MPLNNYPARFGVSKVPLLTPFERQYEVSDEIGINQK